MPARPWLRALPYLVLVLGLAATAVVAYRFDRVATQRNELRFQNAAASVHDRIRVRLETYITMLLGARGLFAGSQAVEREEFRRFVENLEVERRSPGVLGIGYASRVTPEEQAALESSIRKAGFPDFRIWPEGPRDAYYPILYLEPLDRRNRAALGYDMYSDPVRREAMARARDSGLPAASNRVTLVQELELIQQPGFLIYVPVYEGGDTPAAVEERRARLRGFVYSPFRSYDFLREIFGTETVPLLSFQVFDAAGSREPVLQSAVLVTEPGYRPRFEAAVPLEAAGRPWRLLLRSTPAFDEIASGGRTVLMAVGGTLFSVVLSLLMAAQVRARARAEESDRVAQAERAHLHRLFMQAPAPILIQRGRGQALEFMNSAARDLVGTRPLGRPVREGFADIDIVQLAFLDRVFTTGERHVGTEVAISGDWRRDGQRSERFFNIVQEPMRNARGEVDGVMTFGFDVTEQVVARRKLEAMADDLRAALRLRDDFLSIAGHELRTPLSALMLQIDGIDRAASRGAFAADPAQLLDRIRKTRAHTERLERLIGELLDVARISEGHLALQREEMDLVALAREVAERFIEPLARSGSKLALVPEVPSLVGRWDKLRLDQVLTNLLSNAVKYGAGKPIELRVGRGGEGAARLTVKDSGIGVAPKDQARIFERFERAVSERHYGGLGPGAVDLPADRGGPRRPDHPPELPRRGEHLLGRAAAMMPPACDPSSSSSSSPSAWRRRRRPPRRRPGSIGRRSSPGTTSSGRASPPSGRRGPSSATASSGPWSTARARTSSPSR
jgi:CHASE1-domain containing sensor protein